MRVSVLNDDVYLAGRVAGLGGAQACLSKGGWLLVKCSVSRISYRNVVPAV